MLCSPHQKHFYKTHKTCFSKTQLVDIAKQMNIEHNKYIKKRELWQLINEHMWKKKDCAKEDEICWIDHSKTNANNISNAYVPQKPTSWKHDPKMWLSNIDIMQVMSQYSKKYTKLNFLGVFPIDFAYSNILGTCVSKALCNVQFDFNSHDKFAAVFNTDKHYESGSHWICCFCNTNPRSKHFGFYFFDSNGNPCPPEIKSLYESFNTQLNVENFEFNENLIRKQYRNTECGMFCLYFIIESLKNKSFKTIINDDVYDDKVFKLRNVLFRN